MNKVSIFIICSFVLAIVVIVSLGLVGSDTVEKEDKSYNFFNDSYVHEVRLHIDDEDWFNTLYSNHLSSEDPYESATLIHEDYEFYSVGVRFKGSSSFSYDSEKKSFKIDVNEFFENCNIYDKMPECQELSFYGLRKFNLNNGFKDPSFLREKIFFDIAGDYFPTVRTVFVNVYVNDEHKGLYTGVEQPDEIFIEMNYGEVGNLFECERISEEGKGATFGSDLSYLGDDVEDYYEFYELKTVEKEGSWESLIHLIDVLNNYDDESFEQEIENIMDVEEFLAMMALNNLFANYDSYTGSAHNYYVYEDIDGIFHPILWDGNEAFGSFIGGSDGDHVNTNIFFGNYILEERFFTIEKYKERYVEIISQIAENHLNPDKMNEVITNYADLIREDVYNDPLKIYSNEDFENALYYSEDGDTYSLLQYSEERYESVMSQLGES